MLNSAKPQDDDISDDYDDDFSVEVSDKVAAQKAAKAAEEKKKAEQQAKEAAKKKEYALMKLEYNKALELASNLGLTQVKKQVELECSANYA